MHSTINSTVHFRPLNRLEHYICTTSMTYIRPGRIRTQYLWVSCHNRTEWAIGAGHVTLVSVQKHTFLYRTGIFSALFVLIFPEVKTQNAGIKIVLIYQTVFTKLHEIRAFFNLLRFFFLPPIYNYANINYYVVIRWLTFDHYCINTMWTHIIFSTKNINFSLTYHVEMIWTNNQYNYVVIELEIAGLSLPVTKQFGITYETLQTWLSFL